MVEFQRLDVLLGGAKEILSRHNIGTLTLPKEEPSLFIVEESEPAELDPLPVPIVAVPIEDIDTFRTRDFTL
jgi:hypothetical protein